MWWFSSTILDYWSASCCNTRNECLMGKSPGGISFRFHRGEPDALCGWRLMLPGEFDQDIVIFQKHTRFTRFKMIRAHQLSQPIGFLEYGGRRKNYPAYGWESGRAARAGGIHGGMGWWLWTPATGEWWLANGWCWNQNSWWVNHDADGFSSVAKFWISTMNHY